MAIISAVGVFLLALNMQTSSYDVINHNNKHAKMPFTEVQKGILAYYLTTNVVKEKVTMVVHVAQHLGHHLDNNTDQPHLSRTKLCISTTISLTPIPRIDDLTNM